MWEMRVPSLFVFLISFLLVVPTSSARRWQRRSNGRGSSSGSRSNSAPTLLRSSAAHARNADATSDVITNATSSGLVVFGPAMSWGCHAPANLSHVAAYMRRVHAKLRFQIWRPQSVKRQYKLVGQSVWFDYAGDGGYHSYPVGVKAEIGDYYAMEWVTTNPVSYETMEHSWDCNPYAYEGGILAGLDLKEGKTYRLRLKRKLKECKQYSLSVKLTYVRYPTNTTTTTTSTETPTTVTVTLPPKTNDTVVLPLKPHETPDPEETITETPDPEEPTSMGLETISTSLLWWCGVTIPTYEEPESTQEDTYTTPIPKESTTHSKEGAQCRVSTVRPLGHHTGSHAHPLIQYISSPSYPQTYAADLDICWVLRAETGVPIHISFTDLRLDANAKCSKDSIYLYDGDSTEAPLMHVLCWQLAPITLETSGSAMYIRFRSSPHQFVGGFEAVVWSARTHQVGGGVSVSAPLEHAYPVSRTLHPHWHPVTWILGSTLVIVLLILIIVLISCGLKLKSGPQTTPVQEIQNPASRYEATSGGDICKDMHETVPSHDVMMRYFEPPPEYTWLENMNNQNIDEKKVSFD